MQLPVDPKGDLPRPSLQDLAGAKRKSKEMAPPPKPRLPAGLIIPRVAARSTGAESGSRPVPSSPPPPPKKNLLAKARSSVLSLKRKRSSPIPVPLVREVQQSQSSASPLSEGDGMGFYAEPLRTGSPRGPSPVIDLDPPQASASPVREPEPSLPREQAPESYSSPGQSTLLSATELFQPRNFIGNEWVLPNGYRVNPLTASLSDTPNLAISMHHASLITKEVREYAEMSDEQRLREQSFYLMKLIQVTQAGQVDSESRRALNANRLALRTARDKLAATSDELQKVARELVSLHLRYEREESERRGAEKERDELMDLYNNLDAEFARCRQTLVEETARSSELKRRFDDCLLRARTAEDKLRYIEDCSGRVQVAETKQRVAEENLAAEKEIVKTLRDDLEASSSRSSSLEHQLVELQGSLSKQVEEGVEKELDTFLESVEFKRVQDESRLRVIRVYASKLAEKYPVQRASILEATNIFIKELFGDSFPDGLPSPLDDPSVDEMPAFDSYSPAF